MKRVRTFSTLAVAVWLVSCALFPSLDELTALEATLPIQPIHVGAILCGQRVSAGPQQPARAADWATRILAPYSH